MIDYITYVELLRYYAMYTPKHREFEKCRKELLDRLKKEGFSNYVIALVSMTYESMKYGYARYTHHLWHRYVVDIISKYDPCPSLVVYEYPLWTWR